MHAAHEHGSGSQHRRMRHPGVQQGEEAPQTEGRLIHWARRYDMLLKLKFLGRLGKLRSLPVELAHIVSGERVLDVGCGTGDVALSAAKRAGSSGSVYGIDASPEMISVARGKAQRRKVGRNVRFLLEPVEAMSFPDASFDVVLSTLVMHHLPGELKQRALSEVRRVLRPGGRVLLMDLQVTAKSPRPWEPGWLVTKAHRMQRQPDIEIQPPGAPLAAMLESADFRVIERGPTRYGWITYALGQAPE